MRALFFLVVTLFATQVHAQDLCGPLFEGRSSITQTLADKSVVATSAEREKLIADEMVKMNKFIFENPKGADTPFIVLVPAAGVNYKILVASADRTIGRLEVSNIPADGILRATLLVPVSGHTGIENAKKWALTDTYHVNRSDAAHPQETLLVPETASLGSLTAQEVEIPLLKNGITRIFYYRSGSGGPPGYPEGRILEISWPEN